MRRSLVFRSWIVLALSAALAEPAFAADGAVGQLSGQSGSSPGGDRPWARGVPKSEQEAAQKLVDEGNALLKESFFAQAVEKYLRALEHWDHPGTHYNLALALLTLDDPVATHEHFSAAVKYGPEPIEKDKFDVAQNYLALLEKQIAHVEIRCEEPGAKVRLDGRLLFEAPGSYSGRVRRGEHSVTAAKPGFETTELSRMMDSGEPVVIELQVYRPDELVVHERRYPLWVPITVTVTGLVMVGGGGLSSYLSQQSYDRFDGAITENSDCAFGCMPNDETAGHLADGDLFQTLSIIGYAAGGATVATGITLWALGSKSTRRVTPEERQKFSVVPLVSPSAVGLFGTGHF